MKKLFALLLALVLCLTFAACGKKDDDSGENESKADASQTSEDAEPSEDEATEADDSIIEFTDVVLIDDNNVTISLVNFYEKEVNWSDSDGGPQIEKFITFNIKNKTDSEINLWMTSYIGEETMSSSLSSGGSSVDAGRSSTVVYGIRHDTAPYHKALDSLDELYQVEGKFEITSFGSPKAFDRYDAEFSIDKALNGGKESSGTTDANDDANSVFYGTWAVTEVTLPSGTNMTVEYMESQKMYSWSDWKIIVSKEGPLYLQTNNTSNIGDAVLSPSGITAGRNVWTYQNDKLVLKTSDGLKVYYEKESDNQVFPELQKKDFIELLKGTWSISGSRTGSFTFTDNSASASINGVVVYTEASLNVLMDEGKINLHETLSDSGKAVTMEIEYTYENGVLSLTYSGDKLVKN